MKIELDYALPIDPTEPEFTALLFKHVKDQIERVGPRGEFQFVLDRVLYIGEYEVLEPGQLVYSILGSSRSGYATLLPPDETSHELPIIQIEHDDEMGRAVLDDGEITGRA
jgi:hypothetical protein